MRRAVWYRTPTSMLHRQFSGATRPPAARTASSASRWWSVLRAARATRSPGCRPRSRTSPAARAATRSATPLQVCCRSPHVVSARCGERCAKEVRCWQMCAMCQVHEGTKRIGLPARVQHVRHEQSERRRCIRLPMASSQDRKANVIMSIHQRICNNIMSCMCSLHSSQHESVRHVQYAMLSALTSQLLPCNGRVHTHDGRMQLTCNGNTEQSWVLTLDLHAILGCCSAGHVLLLRV